MSDKQQSAVQYLEEQLKKVLIDNQIQQTEYLFNQAKELFKKQIIDAFYDGKSNGMDISHPLSSAKEIPSDQYFNDKFKTESNGK